MYHVPAAKSHMHVQKDVMSDLLNVHDVHAAAKIDIIASQTTAGRYV